MKPFFITPPPSYTTTPLKPIKIIKVQQGISLIELMIAITIGLMAIAGAIQALSTSQQSQRFTQAVETLNEHGRFAMMHLQTDIRNAGDNGCPSWMVRDSNTQEINGLGQFYAGNISDENNTPAWFSHFYRGVEGLTSAPSYLNAYAPDISSDLLIIHKLDSKHNYAVKSHLGTTLELTTTPDLNTGDVAFINTPDCRQAALFLITGVTNKNIQHEKKSGGNAGFKNCDDALRGQSINCANALNTAPIDANSTLSQVSSALYFVDKTSKSLMRLEAGKKDALTLIEGVTSFNVDYGIDINNDGVADNYREASNITTTEWPHIVTLQIALMLHSEENVLKANEIINQQTCGNRTFTGNGQLKSCFTSRINIRNRGGVRL